ncbi:hypothetical protein [Streptomyces thermocarboxydovorans]
MTATLTTPAVVSESHRTPRQLRWLLRLHRPAALAWTCSCCSPPC